MFVCVCMCVCSVYLPLVDDRITQQVNKGMGVFQGGREWSGGVGHGVEERDIQRSREFPWLTASSLYTCKGLARTVAVQEEKAESLYLQLELQLSAVARLLAGDGDLATQLQGHGAVQDPYQMNKRRQKCQRARITGGARHTETLMPGLFLILSFFHKTRRNNSGPLEKQDEAGMHQ